MRRNSRPPPSDPQARLIAAAERLAAAVENFLTAEELSESLEELRQALFQFRRVRAGDGHDPGSET